MTIATFWLPFLLGSFLGSFLNVCIHRLPRNESVVHPPSRCYACGTRLAWYDNIPLLGWLLLRGRCRYCGTSFGAGHLLGEGLMALATGTVCAWVFARQDVLSWMTVAGIAAPWLQGIEAAVLLVFLYYTWVAAAIDARHTIIPDELTKPMQVVAPLLALGTPLSLSMGWSPAAWFVSRGIYGNEVLQPWSGVGLTAGLVLGSVVLLMLSLGWARRVYSSPRLHGGSWPEADHRAFRIGVCWFVAVSVLHVVVLLITALLLPGDGWSVVLLLHACQALLGAQLAWWLLYLIGLVGTTVFRRNAMGYGDVKFLAPLGALLGPVGVLYAFFIAALVGAVIGTVRRLLGAGREIPFGPYLAVGVVLAVPLGPWMTGQFLRSAG